MEQTILLLLGLLAAFLVGLFSSKKQQRTDAKVLDLTAKITQNQNLATKEQADADAKVKEYQDALKAYDPDFHNTDSDGKPNT